MKNRRRCAGRKTKSIWLYLDGKRHCDVVMWALAVNVDIPEAKERLTAMYPLLEVEFRLE